jgi:cell division protein FtsI (penicillin-binding protein 3)
MDSNLETTAEPQSHKRLIIVTWCTLVWGLIIFGRLVQLQVVEHENLANRAKAQQTKELSVAAMRGQILTRGMGKLAMSVPVDSIHVTPLKIPDVDFAVSLLSTALDLDPQDVERRIMIARRDGRGDLRLKEHATLEQVDRVRSFRLDYVSIQGTGRRIYPKQSLAANLLGSLNGDGQGEGGLELSLNEDLAGLDAKVLVERDSRSRGYGRKYRDGAPTAGANVRLTIDEGIQFSAENALREALHEGNIPFGSLVVLHVKTGEILAMASWPTFDPNVRVQEKGEIASRVNNAVSVPFEPGSVCKVVTMTAALETTNLRSETPIPCGGRVMRILGRDIHDEHAYGVLPMEMVLAKSSNLGSVYVGMRVGKENLYDYMRRFGFGTEVAAGLPGESAGVLYPVRKWQPDSIASVAIGHEMMTTTLQLAQAAGIIANNGVWVKPHVVLERQEPGQAPEKEPVPPPEQRIKPETAIKMRRMMEQVVLEGTGKAAKLKGYTSGGKTGTGKIFEVGKGYQRLYNSTFMGFAPVSSPEVVVVVTLNRTSKLAGGVAGPVFRKVAQDALRILGVQRDIPDAEPAPTAEPALGAGAGEEDEEQEEREMNLAQVDPNLVAGPKAPNFKGMTLRAVLQQSAAAGLRVEAVGSGIAKRQEPPAGAVLDATRRIRVVFSR